ncbi:hypothetical protein GOODEAATRI_006518 [Goodea atripinnis]|uniref:Uncharacterized protein n=1 Tax=Goodea atripinnis TaxID=208336 RepID=A0ABV0PBX3_9TELE
MDPNRTHSLMMTTRICSQVEEEEGGDSFDIHLSVSDPEKIGGCSLIKSPCNPEITRHVPTLKEVKQKSTRMTKVKVGKEDQSSNEFVEKRRSALESRSSLIPVDPTPNCGRDCSGPDKWLRVTDLTDESLGSRARRSLPRAVNTQALSSAGILRMVNKAADAVNKMTIKMNESDAVSGR